MNFSQNIKINSWLKTTNKSVPIESNFVSIFPKIHKKEVAPIGFHPKNMLLNNWTEDAPIGNEYIEIISIINILKQDVKKQFKTFHKKSKSKKEMIYNDFVDFIKKRNIQLPELFNSQLFWSSINNPESTHLKILNDFKEEFSFQTASVYLAKIRFILQIITSKELNITEKCLLNPNYFLSHLFKKGTSQELLSRALEQNQFSWYKPDQNLASQIFKYIDIITSISLIDMSRVMDFDFYSSKQKNKNISKRSQAHHPTSKSAVATQSFGELINTFLVFFPIWNNQEILHYPQTSDENKLKVLNIKFAGNLAKDLSIAFWQTQRKNLTIRWSEIIAPNFYNNVEKSTRHSEYLNIINELLLLSFLVDFSSKQAISHDVKNCNLQLICDIMKNKYSKVIENTKQELNLFSATDKVIACDQIIIADTLLSVSALLNNIKKQKQELAKEGSIYILSNHDLTSVENAKKIKQLNKEFKFESILNLTQMTHKGELPAYIYILKLKADDKVIFDAFGTPFIPNKENDKEACYNFTLKGKLQQTNQLSLAAQEIVKFFKTKTNSCTLYVKDISKSLIFEYKMDSFFEGKFKILTSNSNNNFAHPNFLKGLSKNSTSFDSFFKIKPITSINNTNDKTFALLQNSTVKKNHSYQNILIINLLDKDCTEIEIINGDNFLEYAKDNGFVYYRYYGLIPKEKGFDIKAISSFLSSAIGKQIIHLTFNGKTKNFTSLLNYLLIPKFFLNLEVIPSHIKNHLSFLQLSSDQIIKIENDDSELEYLKTFDVIIDQVLKLYPSYVLTKLHNFQETIETSLSKLGSQLNYSNKYIFGPLASKKLLPIYPKNPDLFMEILCDDTLDLNLELTEIKFEKNNNSPYIQLISNQTAILNIYSDIVLLDFLSFICNMKLGTYISSLLMGIKVPDLENLKKVVNGYNDKRKLLFDIQNKTTTMINDTIFKNIIA